ncbi:MAG: carbohydrate kinase [Synoicihabitans sp.]
MLIKQTDSPLPPLPSTHSMPGRPTILCFGEILWDFLPAGLFPGGAPFNVGYHLKQLGMEVHLASGLGRDKLGDELVRRLHGWGISTDSTTFHAGLPTGTVIAEMSTTGDASYQITPSVAWDQILINQDTVQAAHSADALVFGSLALRSQVNRSALDRAIELLPPTAHRVFDVNLRSPHDDLELVRERAKQATLLKLNAEEATRIVLNTEEEQPGREEALARALSHDCGCPIVCITAGSRGAGLLRDDQWYWEDGRPVDVADTVGSGDAFLARLLTHLLADKLTPAEMLASSCRHGEWVATKFGATPSY